jgi:signal transduction histidine kinase
MDIAGLSTDELAIGEHIADEVSSALHRASTIGLSEEAAETRTRLSLARDIHDSIIQLLAGTSFRLEGIRKSAEAGRSIEADVRALQQELSTEQRNLRTFIAELRSRDESKPPSILCNGIRGLLERMERQWNVACELARCPEDLKIASRLEHEVHQIVREAIANAVRHGKADHVSVSLDAGQTGLSLIVADNGTGFPIEECNGGKAEGAGPWSLNERVHELGGTLALYSTGRGSRITISIPFGAMA